MGTGKTSIGKRVAQSLGFQFVDTDDLIVQASGKAITQIFADEGEDHFRDLESQTLLDCSQAKNQVIATGGGIVLREQNREILQRAGYVIWLRTSPESILERVSKNRDRPLLHTEDPLKRIRAMLLERDGLYSSSADFIIDTDELAMEETAFGICESARVNFA
ncbi:MAG: shikimate kinase [Verrucomicrobiales bacterium]|nr:shikimate kinase [Verrucomicrobiales bacterium]